VTTPKKSKKKKRKAVRKKPPLRPVGSVRPQPLLAVRDVRASSRWYSTLLGLDPLDLPSDQDRVYDRLHSDGRLVLQLHAWDDDDQPGLSDRDGGRNGHGILLWFEADDVEAVARRAERLRAEIVRDVHVNPGPGHYELWVRDPDDYLVVVASPDGSARP
jgi:catechol 2,3-dioxygenase-like lactoylglutathione lyase family enzyme